MSGDRSRAFSAIDGLQADTSLADAAWASGAARRTSTRARSRGSRCGSPWATT